MSFGLELVIPQYLLQQVPSPDVHEIHDILEQCRVPLEEDGRAVVWNVGDSLKLLAPSTKQSTVCNKFFPLDDEPDWSPHFYLFAELSEEEKVGLRLQGLPHVIGEAGGDNEVLRSQIGKDNSEDLSIEE